MLHSIYWETKHSHSIWLLHVVVGDGGGGLSSIWNVFTDITFVVYDYMWSLDFRPNESNCQTLDPNVTGIQTGCTNTTDDIERWENEDFFCKSQVSRSQPFFLCSVYPLNITFKINLSIDNAWGHN